VFGVSWDQLELDSALAFTIQRVARWRFMFGCWLSKTSQLEVKVR
jgi:hypothetical protein